jgi:molecular chaperone GrpE
MTTENTQHTTALPVESAPAETPATPPPAGADELEKLKTQAAENWDKYLRAVADFDNYRKRVLRERDEHARATRETVILALLPALDNLERALDHSPAGTPLHEGLLQVQKQFARALAEFGLVELSVKPGDSFDANIHEAIGHVESATQPEGAIIEQHQSAYRLGDRLLRPARVVVSKGPPAPAP